MMKYINLFIGFIVIQIYAQPLTVMGLFFLGLKPKYSIFLIISFVVGSIIFFLGEDVYLRAKTRGKIVFFLAAVCVFLIGMKMFSYGILGHPSDYDI